MSITASELTPADIGAVVGNNGNDGMWGGAWWIIILLLFGWGRNGYGNGSGGSVSDGYVLASDFATIQRQLSDGFGSIDNALDRQNAGICDLGYTNLSLNNQTNMNLMNGFYDVTTAIKDCCCTTQQNLKDVNYNLATQANGLQRQIADCCCNVERQIERGFCDTNYNLQTQHNQTIQEIDRSADRIIDWLSNEKLQNLRDENFALKLNASQAQQNNLLINTLRPTPIPSFSVPNIYAYNNGCLCQCG